MARIPHSEFRKLDALDFGKYEPTAPQPARVDPFGGLFGTEWLEKEAAEHRLKLALKKQADAERVRIKRPSRSETIVSVPEPGSMAKDYSKGIAGASKAPAYFSSPSKRM